MIFLREMLADIRERLARWLTPDLLFNSDMSSEIDRLIAENDTLRARIKELEDGE